LTFSFKSVVKSDRQWLEATADTDYPDLPSQILAYFRARRAGDIAVFAAPGWDFGQKNHAGHGGLRPEEMFVPILLAGPGVPAGRADAVRTVDIMPTLLELLGRPAARNLDGHSLLGGSEQPTKPAGSVKKSGGLTQTAAE